MLKVPPHNLEAEQSVIGALLLDNLAFAKVAETLVPDDFYRKAHRLMFNAMLDLFERNEPVDLVTLSNALGAEDILESAGGTDALAQLVDLVPTTANVEYYARIVKEKAILRRLINKSSEILNECYREKSNLEDFLDEVEQEIFRVAQDRSRKSYFPIKEVVKVNFEKLEALAEHKGALTGIPSGFNDLDALTAGFQRSDLIILAARPSMGKTALALDIARYAAVEEQIPVGVFSLEMSKEQIGLRLLCSKAKIDSSKLRRGYLQSNDWMDLTEAAGELSDSPIYIDDTPAVSVLEMRAKARRLKSERDLGLIVVDYLQLMRGRPGLERREQEISEISRSLKALAKELDIPIIALSQLNRRVEERHDKRPQLSDLRESGAIEQDADVILFIYRDEVYNKEPNNPEIGTAEIIVGKQRNGPIGDLKLAFLADYATFENYTAVEDPMA